MSTVGERLREARLRQGLSLQEVVQATKIRSRHLEALELGELDPAVGVVYYRGFLRTYARYLGLDPGELLAELDGELGVEMPPTEPVRRRRRGRRRWSWFWALLALALAGYWWWTLRAPAPPAVTDPPPVVTPSEPEPAPPPAPVVEPPPAPEPPAPPPLSVEREDPSATRTVFRLEHGERLELTLTLSDGPEDRCWIRVVADGAPVFEGILDPGMVVTYRGEDELTLRLGKPWVVRLELNGIDLGAAGPLGPAKDLRFLVKR